MAHVRQDRDEALARLRAAQRFGGCTRAALLGGAVRGPLLTAMADTETAKVRFGMRGADLQKRWLRLVELAGSRPAALGFVQVDGTLRTLAKQLRADQATLARNLRAWERRDQPPVVVESIRGKKPTVLVQLPLLTDWLLWTADARAVLQRGHQGFIGADVIRQVAVTLIGRGLGPPPEKALLPLDAQRMIRLAHKY
ncbi:MAG: hypothetical protein VX833_09300 [Actinomycetota bacterium]|nr:hypothetical protein [Actinomycetota bacterium]